MEQQRLKYIQQGLYVDYHYMGQYLPFKVFRIKDGLCEIRQANNFRVSQTEKLGSKKIAPFRTRSVFKEEHPSTQYRHLKPNLQEMQNNLDKLNDVIGLIEGEGLDKLLETNSAIGIIQFFGGQNYFQILRIFSNSFESRDGIELVIKYFKTFLKFVVVYWHLIDLRQTKPGNFYQNSKSAFMGIYPAILNNLGQIAGSRNLASFISINTKNTTQQEFDSLIINWFKDQMYSVLKEKNFDELDESIAQKFIKIYVQIKSLKEYKPEIEHLEWFSSFFQYVIDNLMKYSSTQIQNINNQLPQIQAILKEQVNQSQRELYRVRIQTALFVKKAQVANKASDMISQLRCLHSYFIHKKADLIQQIINFPYFDNGIKKFCALQQVESVYGPCFEFIETYKKYIPEVILEALITHKKYEIFKKLKWQVRQLMIAPSILQNGELKSKQQLKICLQILQELQKNKDTCLIDKRNQLEKLLHLQQSANTNGQQKQPLKQQLHNKKEALEQKLNQIEHITEQISKCVLVIGEKIITSDSSSLLIDLIQKLVIRKNTKFIKQQMLIAINSPETNIFKECYIIRHALDRISRQKMQLNRRLSNQALQNNKAIKQIEQILIEYFDSLCLTTANIKNKNQLLEHRKQNICLLLGIFSKEYPQRFYDMVVKYLKYRKDFEEQPNCKCLQKIFNSLKTEAHLKSRDKSEIMEILQQILKEIRINNMGSLKVCQQVFYLLNKYDGKLEDNKTDDCLKLSFKEEVKEINNLHKFYQEIDRNKTQLKKLIIQTIYKFIVGIRNKQLRQEKLINHLQFLFRLVNKYSQSSHPTSREFTHDLIDSIIKVIEIDNKGIKKREQSEASKNAIAALKQGLGRIYIQIKNEDLGSNWRQQLTSDYQLGYIKSKGAIQSNSFPCEYDLIINGDLIEGGELNRWISKLFADRYERERQSGRRQNYTNTIVLNMKKNNRDYLIGSVLFDNIETIFNVISENNLLWECLPITQQRWTQHPFFSRLLSCFLYAQEHNQEDYALYNNINQSQQKKQIVISAINTIQNLKIHQPNNLCKSFNHLIYANLNYCLCINNFLIGILFRTNHKLTKQDMLMILDTLDFTEHNRLIYIGYIEKQPQYRKFVSSSLTYALNYADFDIADLMFEISEDYYRALEKIPYLDRQMTCLWRNFYHQNFEQQPYKTFTKIIKKQTILNRFSLEMFMKVILQENGEINNQFNNAILQMFITSMSKPEFFQESLTHKNMFLKLVKVVMVKGGVSEEIINEKFIKFIDQHLYTDIGPTAVEIIDLLTNRYKPFMIKYIDHFNKMLNDELFEVDRKIEWSSLKDYQYNRQMYSFTGLDNPHSICYANSLIQQLYRNVKFRHNLYQTDWKKHPQQKQDLLYQLKRTFINLQQRNEPVFMNKQFFNAFKNQAGDPIEIDLQMDVDQFRNILFERLENQIKTPGEESKEKINGLTPPAQGLTPPGQRLTPLGQGLIPSEQGLTPLGLEITPESTHGLNSGQPEKVKPKNFIQKIFHGTMKTTIEGQKCGHISSRQQQFSSICLDVKGIKCLQQSLQKYFTPEIFEGENSYFCEECKAKVKAQKRLAIQEYPQNMIFVLKRFEYYEFNESRIKINEKFEFPHRDFEISKGIRYKLTGMIVHQGVSEAGHYISFLKDQKIWYQLNDSTCDEIEQEKAMHIGEGQQRISNKSAYLLFYQKINEQEQAMEQQPYFNGLQQQIKNIQIENSMNHRVNMINSTEFQDLIKKLCKDETNPKLGYDLLFLYIANIKIDRNQQQDERTKQFSELFDLLEQTAIKQIIDTQLHLKLVFKIFENPNMSASIKGGLIEKIAVKYHKMNALYQNLLVFCIKGISENFESAHLFKMMYLLAKKDEEVLKFLVKNMIVARILLMTYQEAINEEVLGQIAKIPQEIQVNLKQRWKKYDSMSLKYHKWKLMNYIVESGIQLSKIEKQIFLTKNMAKKLALIFDEAGTKANINQITKLCCYFSYDNERFSQDYLQFLSDIIHKGEQLRKCLRGIAQVLKVNDELQKDRQKFCKNLIIKSLKENNDLRKYLNFDIIWQWLLKIVAKNLEFRSIVYIFLNEFDLLLKEGRNCLFSCRIDYYRNEVKSRYHGLKFGNSISECLDLCSEKVKKTKHIFDVSKCNKLFNDPSWDSDDDLTDEKIKKGQKIMKFNLKYMEFQEYRVKEVCGDCIEIEVSHKNQRRFDKGDDIITKCPTKDSCNNGNHRQ